MKPNYLENIPQNWQIKKLKYVAKVQTGGTPKIQGADFDCFENGVLDWFTAADFNESGILDKSKRKINEQAIKEIEIFSENSVYLVSIGATLGKVGISPKKASANQQINIIIFDDSKLYPKFGFFMLKANTEYIINEADHTTLPILNQNKTKHLSFLIPPISEQQRIANFLDKKTTELDTLIKKKKKLIKLLQEDEKAFINEKLTDTEGKWKKTKLKYIADTVSGSTPNSGEQAKYYNGEILWVRTTDLNDDELFDTEKKITQQAVEETACKLVPEQTILIAMYGGAGSIGKNAILKTEATLNQSVCGIISKQNIVNPYFLFYFFKKYRKNLMQYAVGTRRDPNISQDIIKNLRLPCPSIEEQNKIVSEIKNYIHKNRQVLKKLSKEVDLLKEYRQSLISEAVTGQLVI